MKWIGIGLLYLGLVFLYYKAHRRSQRQFRKEYRAWKKFAMKIDRLSRQLDHASVTGMNGFVARAHASNQDDDLVIFPPLRSNGVPLRSKNET